MFTLTNKFVSKLHARFWTAIVSFCRAEGDQEIDYYIRNAGTGNQEEKMKRQAEAHSQYLHIHRV